MQLVVGTFDVSVSHIHTQRENFWQVHQAEFLYKRITENMLLGQKMCFI